MSTPDTPAVPGQTVFVNAGWTVLRFSRHDLKFRPDYVVRTLRACLGAPQPLFR